MNESDIRSGLTQAIRAIAPEAMLDAIDPSENLRQALDIDSFDFLRVLSQIHQRFGVDIPESDYGKVQSLDALVRYLGERAMSRA